MMFFALDYFESLKRCSIILNTALYNHIRLMVNAFGVDGNTIICILLHVRKQNLFLNRVARFPYIYFQRFCLLSMTEIQLNWNKKTKKECTI